MIVGIFVIGVMPRPSCMLRVTAGQAFDRRYDGALVVASVSGMPTRMMQVLSNVAGG